MKVASSSSSSGGGGAAASAAAEAELRQLQHDLQRHDMNLQRYYEQQKSTARSDEQLVTRAKEMGKELFNYLPPLERRDKLDAMVCVGGGGVWGGSTCKTNRTHLD